MKLLEIVKAALTSLWTRDAWSQDPAFRERGFRERAASFCMGLAAFHHQLDYDTRWSPAKFVPLDAEVEMGTPDVRGRIVNLLDAIRGDRKSRLFLVLGEPGAGKSVALRRLAVDMLREFPRTGRIPVYINLRDWRIPSSSMANLTTADFYELVKDVLSRQSGRDGAAFVAAYFDRLVKHGRLVGLEIPVKDLYGSLGADRAESVCSVLSFAQLARLGRGSGRRISFAHRRLHEFFVARRFIESPETPRSREFRRIRDGVMRW